MTSVRTLVTALLFATALMPVAPGLARAQCNISLVQDVNFGAYDVFNAAPVDSIGRFTVSCSNTRWVEMRLSRGSAPTYFPRQMRFGVNVLTYNLYLDAARTTIWGDGTGGTQFLRVHIRNATEVVYGRIPSLQDAAAGAYTDTVVITINF